MYARFGVFRTFLCIFMSAFRVFVREELWVNVPVAIFFLTVDSLAWVIAQCCTLRQYTLLSQCLIPFLQEYKWVPANCHGNLTKMLGGYLRWIGIQSREVAILLVASFYGNRS